MLNDLRSMVQADFLMTKYYKCCLFRFDQQATEQFPPPPRLFRSRSDETLSHSEYSYHGRAFKSKEAAMEELKTLKHHEEVNYDTNPL